MMKNRMCFSGRPITEVRFKNYHYPVYMHTDDANPDMLDSGSICYCIQNFYLKMPFNEILDTYTWLSMTLADKINECYELTPKIHNGEE